MSIPSEKTSEAAVASLISSFLQTHGYKVWAEVPTMGQCADIVAFRNQKITVVEVKLKDWKRAFQQCIAHNNVGDYICIAVATAGIPEALIASATLLGYGIIHCSLKEVSCKWVLMPKRNHNIWLPQQKRLRNQVQEISYGY